MKNLIRLSVVIFMVLGMLLNVFPALAGTKTEVTGTMTPLDQYYLDPERQWMSNHIWHWRNETMGLQIEATDPRLNGYDLMSNNGDIYFSINGDYLSMHIYNQGVIYAEPELITPLWACTGNGGYDALWNFTSEVDCHGIGSYAGLVAHLSISAPEGDMIFEGEILEP